MPNKSSLEDVFRHYIESEQSIPFDAIDQLISSGALSRDTFNALMEVKEISTSPYFKVSLVDFALAFLRRCIEDHEISLDEMIEFQDLVTILQIEEGEFCEIRRDLVEEILVAQATQILGDRHVTKQEDILQRDLQRALGLSYDQYVSFLRPLVKKHIQELETKKLGTEEPEELRVIDSSIQNLRSIFLIADNSL